MCKRKSYLVYFWSNWSPPVIFQFHPTFGLLVGQSGPLAGLRKIAGWGGVVWAECALWDRPALLPRAMVVWRLRQRWLWRLAARVVTLSHQMSSISRYLPRCPPHRTRGIIARWQGWSLARPDAAHCLRRRRHGPGQDRDRMRGRPPAGEMPNSAV